MQLIILPAQALISMGRGNLPVTLGMPGGVTQWPSEKEETARNLLLEGSKDLNGNPNDVRSVLKNILRKSADNRNHLVRMRAAQEQQKFNNMRINLEKGLGPKKMTQSRHPKVAASSRKRSKRHKFVQQEDNANLIGTTVSVSTAQVQPETERKAVESSEGYVGDAEEIKNAIAANNTNQENFATQQQVHQVQSLNQAIQQQTMNVPIVKSVSPVAQQVSNSSTTAPPVTVQENVGNFSGNSVKGVALSSERTTAEQK